MQSLLTFTDATELQTLLQQPCPNLEEVLDQENIALEVKEGNLELVAYLTQSDNFNSLVSYVSQITLDKSNNGQPSQVSKCTKFPFVACEILSSGNQQIIKRFLGSAATQENSPNSTSTSANSQGQTEQPNAEVSDKPPVAEFLNFLNTSEPLDFTLTGYFCKVLKSLFQAESKAVAELLFSSDNDYMKKMINHLYSDSVQDLFVTVLKLDASYFRSSNADHYLNERISLVEQIISSVFEKSILSDYNDLASDRLTNYCLILCSILGGFSCFPSGKKIIAPLMSAETFYKIIEGLLNPYLIKPLMPLVQQLCTHYRDIYSSKDKMPLLDLIRYTECVVKPKIPDNEPFILAVLNTIDKIIASIKLEKYSQPIQNQEPSQVFNPNQRKVDLCEVMLNFLKLQNANIDAKIIESEGLTVLVDMFIKNPWNSILHSGLTKLVTFVVEHGSLVLKETLFEKTKILDFIMKEAKEPEVVAHLKTGNKTKKCYIGHLNILSNLIDGIDDSYIQEFVANNEEWQNYKNDILKKENEKNKGVDKKSMPPGFYTSENKDAEGALPKFKLASEYTHSPRRSEQKEEKEEEWDADEGPEATPKSSKACANVGWGSF